MKCIDFDHGGFITEYFVDQNEKNNLSLINKDSYNVAYSNKILLNEWCNSNLNFLCTEGVGVESFFNKISWYHTPENIKKNCKYFWGNDTFKKVNDSNNIFGSSPFVYSKLLYKDTNFVGKYQTVFFPKSESSYEMRLTNKKSLFKKFVENIQGIGLSNPIYIAFPTDYDYYQRYLPPNMVSRLYSIGIDRYDINWNTRLVKLILNSKELYFNVLSTPCVFSAFLNKSIKFYSSDIQYLPEEIINSKNNYSLYNYGKKKNTEEWITFMKYINDVFEYRTKDIDFWIYYFLSLHLIQRPKDLYENLLELHYRNSNNSSIIKLTTPVFEDNLYEKLQNKVSKLNPIRSKMTDYFSNIL